MHVETLERLDPAVLTIQALLQKIDHLRLPQTSRYDVENILVHQVAKELDRALPWQAGHGARTAVIACLIGQELGLDVVALHNLKLAALLHDIGMLKLDAALQHDSKLCAKHTLLGSRMLGRIRLWQDLAPIVHHHHEWFDGTGYPDGIAGEAIPLEARIVALCDAFDSMTSATSYKPARPLAAAVHEIEACAGTQFDPALVQRFVALIDQGELVVPT